MEASAKGLTRWEISDLYSPPELSWSQGFVVFGSKMRRISRFV